MKKLTILCLALICYFTGLSQPASYVLSEKDWTGLISLLNHEKWPAAEKRSAKLLGKCKNDSLADPAILRYMYIRCVAAQLGENKYSKSVALQKVNPLIGQTVLTPPREFNPKRMFNGFKLSEEHNSFMTCSSNREMTTIQSFEYFFFADPEVVEASERYTGKNLRIGAFIRSIEANGDTMPRLDIVFENAFVWEED